jgi:hypothetical protein
MSILFVYRPPLPLCRTLPELAEVPLVLLKLELEELPELVVSLTLPLSLPARCSSSLDRFVALPLTRYCASSADHPCPFLFDFPLESNPRCPFLASHPINLPPTLPSLLSSSPDGPTKPRPPSTYDSAACPSQPRPCPTAHRQP